MTDNSSLPPAGWYADPQGADRQRYWDGSQWTEHFAPSPATPAAAESPVAAAEPAEVAPVVTDPAPFVPSAAAATGPSAGTGAATHGAAGFPVGRVGAIILAGWSIVTALRVVTSDVFEYEQPFFRGSDTGLSSLFTSPWAAGGILGNRWDWFFDYVGRGILDVDVIGPFTSPVFLVTIATAVAAVMASLGGERAAQFQRVAALLAFGHVALFVLLWMPLLEDFGEFYDLGTFFPGLIVVSIVPVLGGTLALVGSAGVGAVGARGGRGERQPFAPTVFGPDEEIIAVENGVRFGSYVLEGLLAVVTLFIGYLVWSLVLWGRGQTPGKQILGLAVVERTSRTNATWGTMFLREFVGKGLIGSISCGITGVVSAFMILLGSERRGVWDSVANTVVVRQRSAPTS